MSIKRVQRSIVDMAIEDNYGSATISGSLEVAKPSPHTSADIINLQSEVIRLQAEIIRLQQRIDGMTAPEPTNEDVWFHVATGKLPDDVFNGENLEEIQAYVDYMHRFVNKQVAPYIHTKTKLALFAYLMRGIAELQSRIQTRQFYTELLATPPMERQPARSGAKAQ